MKLFSRNKNIKRCPYCKTKNNINSQACANCELDFMQIKDCSNIEAKNLLKHRRFGESFEGEIVNVKKYPKDVSKKKTVLLAVFLGFFGAHNFYVGNFVKAWISFVLGLFFLACSVVVSATVDLGIGTANTWFVIGLFAGIFPAICWLFDLVAIIFNKFEMPILLKKPVEIPEEDE